MAEADGLPVEVRNYGRPGIAMWQELELFEQMVSSGQKPDLVVFYDGFNDLAWQMNVRLSPQPDNIYDSTVGQAAETSTIDTNATAKRPAIPVTTDSGTTFSDVTQAYWDQSASHHVYDAMHDLIVGSDAPKVQFAKGVQQRETSDVPASDESLQAAKNAVSIQSRAAKLATAVARSVGADASFYWQPNVFTKRLLPDEQAYLGLGSYEPARWDPAVREARTMLKKTPFVDLGAALDSATEPVLWDFVHTNEVGARLSAEAIYAHVHQQLQQRVDEGTAR